MRYCVWTSFRGRKRMAHGVTLAWELSRVAQRRPKPGFWFDVTMSAIRGSANGFGTAFLYGAKFGITFGELRTIE